MKKPAEGTKYRFITLLNECETHKKRIDQAVSKAKTIFPLSADAYSKLADDEIEHIDQLVYRFTKLQDVLGAKLFPLIVSVVREDYKMLTIFDVLNELEKREVISSKESWMALREIRNQIAHDYENDPETGSFYLNEVFAKTNQLIQTADQVMCYINQYILSSLPQ